MKKARNKAKDYCENTVEDIKRWWITEVRPADIVIVLGFLASVFYFGVYFFIENTENGEVCLRLMVCAQTTLQMACLVVSRVCAGLIFPALFVVMLSKLAYSRAGLSHSFLSEMIDFSKFHIWHSICGKILFWSSLFHGVAHTIRLLVRGQGSDLLSNPTGYSGIVGTALLLFIATPMMYRIIKTYLSFEKRKLLHYITIAWLADLTGHTDNMLIINLCLLGTYLVDYGLSVLFLTFRVEHATFEAIGKGIAVTFPIPPRMSIVPGQYIYLNVPWISLYQWHAFSLMVDVDYEDSSKYKGYLFIAAIGDFTEELFQTTLALKHNPVLWINGPHPSPFMHAVNYSKIVLIASGAGITPAISVIEELHSQRTVFLIFVTNDVTMVRFFAKKLGKVKSTVFFTGSSEDYEKLKKFFSSEFFKAHVLNASPATVPVETDQLLLDAERTETELKEIFDDRVVVFPESPAQVQGPQMAEEKKDEDAPKPFYLQASESFIHKHGQGDTVSLAKGRPQIMKEIRDIINNDERERKRTLHTASVQADVGFVREKTLELLEPSFENWTVMYCGASKALSKSVEEACDSLGVRFSSEYFASW